MRLSLLTLTTLLLLWQWIGKFEFDQGLKFIDSDDPVIAECSTDAYLQSQLNESSVLRQRHETIENNATTYFRQFQQGAESGFMADYTLPVVVHIIHQNGPENISDADVDQGITWLNDAFANINYYNQGVGVDTRIEFCLAERDPDGNATTGINRVVSPLTNATNDLALKDLSRWDPTRYINVWLVANIPGAGGYATLPSSHGLPTDGIVMLADKMLNVGSGHSTFVHEMGHYLGLYHVFQGGCTNNDCLTDGDRVLRYPSRWDHSSTSCLHCSC